MKFNVISYEIVFEIFENLLILQGDRIKVFRIISNFVKLEIFFTFQRTLNVRFFHCSIAPFKGKGYIFMYGYDVLDQ